LFVPNIILFANVSRNYATSHGSNQIAICPYSLKVGKSGFVVETSLLTNDVKNTFSADFQIMLRIPNLQMLELYSAPSLQNI